MLKIGGSIKNVIALAAGIIAGLGYGDNPKAALITRGLVEIKRLGAAVGAKEETFSGLSGLGDLIVHVRLFIAETGRLDIKSEVVQIFKRRLIV